MSWDASKMLGHFVQDRGSVNFQSWCNSSLKGVSLEPYDEVNKNLYYQLEAMHIIVVIMPKMLP